MTLELIRPGAAPEQGALNRRPQERRRASGQPRDLQTPVEPALAEQTIERQPPILNPYKERMPVIIDRLKQPELATQTEEMAQSVMGTLVTLGVQEMSSPAGARSAIIIENNGSSVWEARTTGTMTDEFTEVEIARRVPREEISFGQVGLDTEESLKVYIPGKERPGDITVRYSGSEASDQPSKDKILLANELITKFSGLELNKKDGSVSLVIDQGSSQRDIANLQTVDEFLESMDNAIQAGPKGIRSASLIVNKLRHGKLKDDLTPDQKITLGLAEANLAEMRVAPTEMDAFQQWESQAQPDELQEGPENPRLREAWRIRRMRILRIKEAVTKGVPVNGYGINGDGQQRIALYQISENGAREDGAREEVKVFSSAAK